MSSIDFPKEYLTKMWNEVDWKAAEKKLAKLQERLTIATFRKDAKQIEDTQKRIVRDIDIKCLAVRHVVASSISPGVDGIKWRTPAEKMEAALSLDSRNYHASPMRQIIIKAKNTGKERHPRIPTYFDRAMNVLYGYSLIPVTEAMAERKSFAFRPGRSTQDAHAYVMEALKGNNAPNYVVCADIKAFYAHIQHAWLLANVPMDKKVLAEFLNAGIVFAGELFPAEDEGISEGSNISPYLGNFVLDGLQRFLFQGLHGTIAPADFANGNLIRFADDILVTVRSEKDAETVISLLNDFLSERGLALSEEKTRICNVCSGFTFLSRTYRRKDNVMYARPSDTAVERFISELRIIIENNTKSQRDLILLLNRKLKGWAGYHRYTDARSAFKKIDTAVQAALLDYTIKKYPKTPLKKIIEKYWYQSSNRKHCYALPDDKSIRVVRLSDTVLLTHNKVKTNANPFVEREYTERRINERDIQNVTGKYRSVWERQGGLCYYCGRPILVDQPRTIVTIDLKKTPSIRNSAYVHKMCVANEYEIVKTMEDISILRPFDVYALLDSILTCPSERKSKTQITPEWKYYKLKKYFSRHSESSITLTFSQIEKIIGFPLPASARRTTDCWYPRSKYNTLAEAWLTEGYSLFRLDIPHEKMTLHRNKSGVSKLNIPDVILNEKLPDNAVYELETHMDYIIKKYGLSKKKSN